MSNKFPMTNYQPKYKVIDHPSDIGIEAFGKDQKELFQNAAYGMMDMMFETFEAKPDQKFDIKVSAENMESLMVSWLSELLYIADSKKVQLSAFNISKITDEELEASALGGKYTRSKGSLRRQLIISWR